MSTFSNRKHTFKNSVLVKGGVNVNISTNGAQKGPPNFFVVVTFCASRRDPYAKFVLEVIWIY